jgi:hypothetical protein
MNRPNSVLAYGCAVVMKMAVGFAMPSVADTDADTQAIKNLIAAYATSIDRADTKLADQLFSNAPEVTFIHPLGEAHGRDQSRDGGRRGSRRVQRGRAVIGAFGGGGVLPTLDEGVGRHVRELYVQCKFNWWPGKLHRSYILTRLNAEHAIQAGDGDRSMLKHAPHASLFQSPSPIGTATQIMIPWRSAPVFRAGLGRVEAYFISRSVPTGFGVCQCGSQIVAANCSS